MHLPSRSQVKDVIDSNIFAYILGLTLGAGMVILTLICLQQGSPTGPTGDPIKPTGPTGDPPFVATLPPNNSVGPANQPGRPPTNPNPPADHPANPPTNPAPPANL